MAILIGRAKARARVLAQLLAFAFLLLGAPAAWTQVSGGSAVSLNGTDYVRTTLWSHQLFENESFTFELWFNAASPGVLIGEADTADTTVWDVAFAEIFPGGVIKAGVPEVPTITVGTVAFGEWHHLALVYSEPDRALRAYLNGILTASSPGNRKHPRENERTAVYTFGRGGVSNLGGGNWLSGRFDEIRIWNIPLDTAQISANWNRILISSPVGLVGLWHFDSTTGSVSPDSRAGGNNPAWYVPIDRTTPLVVSTVPFLGAVPIVLTQNASVTQSSAVLSGTANPQGSPMSVFFQWGETTAYGNSTATNAIGSASNEVNFTETISGLRPGTYHYRALGLSGAAAFVGEDRTFIILAPAILTRPAVVTDTVLLQGRANPRGHPLSVHFEWGATTAYGSATPSESIGNGSADINFSAPLTGLRSGSYHYRAVGIYSEGAIYGDGAAFVVPSPSVETKPPTILRTTATLQGVANPRYFASSVHFEWGPTTAYGNSTPTTVIGNGNLDVPFSETLRDLPIGEYHYRAVIASADETIRGADQSFVIAGPAGLAARLSGTDYIRTTIWSDAIFSGEDFTFELWFNAASPGVLVNETDTASAAAWDVAFAEVFPGGVIKAGAPGVPTFTVGTIAFGTWHHLAIVYSGAAKTMFAYLDGSPAGSSAGDRQTPKEISRTSVYCLGRGGPVNLGGGNWFSGQFDEVRIWRRPLSAAEIAGSFDKVLNSTDANLMGYWHFDEINAATPYLSPDASGKNNHAWHVPESVAMPLVNSGASVVLDRRPVVSSLSVRQLAPNSVELEGMVNPFGESTDAYFEYGQDGSPFQRTPAVDVGRSETAVRFAAPIVGLQAGLTYTFHLVASNSFGLAVSSNASFTKTGWAGFAFRFAPNDYIRTATAQNSRFTNKNITIELWFNPTKAGVLASETTFPTSPAYDRSVIEVLPSGSVQAGFNGLTPITLGNAKFNQWNHVALRYNDDSQLMDGFLNGVRGLVMSGVRITPAERGVNGQFAFGRSAITRLGTGEYFGGDLDEIRVWGVARSDLDLTSARYNLLAGDEPGLVFNWRLDGGATNPIPDSSPKENNASNFGAESVLSTAPLVFNVRRVGPSSIETQFVAPPLSNYRFEFSEDLQVWTPVSTNPAPASGYIRIPRLIDPAKPIHFFRTVPH